MTQTGGSNTIVNLMLGWLKGLASWVLRLFNLSGGFSPLKFLADNWLKLLVLLLIVGMAADLLIWLIRWRPHWVWFHRKRVIINDKDFFAGENDVDVEDDWKMPMQRAQRSREPARRRDWRDDDFVVAGAARRRREEREREEERLRKARAEQRKSMRLAAEVPVEVPDDVFTDGMFNVNAKQRFSDRYEDEVFSVIDLPTPKDGAGEPARRARREREPAARGAGASRGGASRARRGGSPRGGAGRSDARRRTRTNEGKR